MAMVLFLVAEAKAVESGPTEFPTPPVQLSPTVSVGIPHLLNFGLDGRFLEDFGAGLGGGALDFEISRSSGLSIGMSNIDLRGRWHPFHGTFLLGAILGRQSVSIATHQDFEISGQDVPTRIELDVNTYYLTPHLGWFYSASSGFTLGLEIGYQLALIPTTNIDVSVNDPKYEALLDRVKSSSATSLAVSACLTSWFAWAGRSRSDRDQSIGILPPRSANSPRAISLERS